MTIKPKLLLSIVLFISFSANAQFGGLKNKIKDKVKEVASPTKQSNPEPSKENPPPKKEKAEPEVIPESKRESNKDAQGFLINDPDITAALSGRDVYQSTDIRLFASLLDTYVSFKMSGVGVSKTANTLDLFMTAKKQYDRNVKKEISMKLRDDGFYEYTMSGNTKVYGAILEDGSILLFDSQNAELISKDENKVKTVTEPDLMTMAEGPMKKIRQKANADKNRKLMEDNARFFKSGDVAAVKNDPKLEAQFLKILNDANALPTVNPKDKVHYDKLLLFYTDWTVVKNEYGLPLKMTYGAWGIGYYTSDHTCFFQRLYMKKDYLGGGQYGEPKFDEGMRPDILACEALK